MSQIKIEKSGGENVFAELREDWRRLFNAANVSPFLSHEWLATWFRWFGKDRAPFVLQAFRDNQLIGLLPLCLEEKKVLGMRLKRLAFIGEEVGGADYLDVIAKPEDKAEVLAAMFDFLKNEIGFDVICLENLRSDSATVTRLYDLNRRETKWRMRHSVLTTAVCPQIELGGDWEKLLSRMYRAREFKRKLRKLEKMAGFEFKTLTAAEDVEAAFERFVGFHEKRWQSRGGSEVTSHPMLLNFHRDVVKKMADGGLLRFEEIWVEGECRASVYGLEKDAVFYLYNTGFNQEWAKLSPGFVLIGHSIEQAIARGVQVYDFLRGDETYKFDWANGQAELVAVSLSRRTIPALAHEGLNQTWRNFKNFSNFALSDGLSERLKNVKRAWKRKNQLADLEVEAASKAV